MRILITTPLFPPDTAAPAPYVKELAKKLSKKHLVTVVTYGFLPETVEEVNIITVNKRQPLFSRVISLMTVVISHCKKNDILYVENGASSEFAAFVASFFVNTPIVMHLGDPIARRRAQKGGAPKIISTLLRQRVKQIIEDCPTEKPEILPFCKKPTFEEYEKLWEKHLKRIESHFKVYATLK